MTTPMVIAVGAGSAERLAALHKASFDEPWEAPAIAGILATPGSFGLVAVEETSNANDLGTLLGFVLMRVAADEAEILTIAVDPAHRGQGIGRRLLEGASALALIQGARTLFLEVADDNGPALGLYEGMGFRAVGTRPGYYRRGAAAVAARIMRLDLAPAP